MGAAEADAAAGEAGPLEEGDRTPGGALLIGIEEMPMEGIILIDRELNTP